MIKHLGTERLLSHFFPAHSVLDKLRMEKKLIFLGAFWGILLASQICFTVDGAGEVESLSNQIDCAIQNSSYCKVKVSSFRFVSVVCKITQVCELATLMADKTNATHL